MNAQPHPVRTELVEVPARRFDKLDLNGLCSLDRLPPWSWLALQAAALWPHALWAVQRAADGSDDPLGLAALAVLAVAVVRWAPALRTSPKPGWLGASLLLTAGATAALWALPPLAGAVLAALAFGAALAAWLPADVPRAPLAGLTLLALPVVASLQFYAGYPLRVLTAQISTWALQAAGYAAERSGAAMTVDGHLVIVDAPCSGVQLVWCAYFCACAAAVFTGQRDRTWLRRLPLVGVLVLAGNALRNTMLVAGEARGAIGEAGHQVVGLAVLLVVCAAVVVWMGRRRSLLSPLGRGWVRGRRGSQCGVLGRPSPQPSPRGRGSQLQTCHGAWLGTVLLACAALPLARFENAEPATGAIARNVEWPLRFDGRVLRPMALSPVEQRFANAFPGAIARFTDGERLLVLRQVQQPTRMLHPAADCYRGLGYRIEAARLERDAQQRLWRCFRTERGSANDATALRVCERIEDANGEAYTDASAWFWAAALGRSTGPWQAITVVDDAAHSASNIEDPS